MLPGEWGGPALGVVCALASALTWTLIGVVARLLDPYLGAVTINMLRSVIGGVLLTAVVLLSGTLHTLGGVPATAWISLGISIVTAFVIGDTAFFEATKSIGLAR